MKLFVYNNLFSCYFFPDTSSGNSGCIFSLKTPLRAVEFKLSDYRGDSIALKISRINEIR